MGYNDKKKNRRNVKGKLGGFATNHNKKKRPPPEATPSSAPGESSLTKNPKTVPASDI